MSIKELNLEADTRFRHFNWEKAKAFYYVTKFGSFTKAGAFLRVSQSALSRSVAEIEEALGLSLFIREPRGVKLTRKGEELFGVVEHMFLGITDFTRKAHAKSQRQKKRKIRIATTHAITAYILDTHIFAYNKQHPDLAFELITDDHLIDIVLNDVDIAIRPYDPHAKGVEQELLFTLEKKLFASEEYLKEYGEPKNVEDLIHHHIIAPSKSDRYSYSEVNWILGLGLEKGEFHDPVFMSTSLECLIKATKEGLGIFGSYEEMELVQKHNLKNILPNIKDKKIKDYFTYPNSLKKDKQIMDLKNYLQQKLYKN